MFNGSPLPSRYSQGFYRIPVSQHYFVKKHLLYLKSWPVEYFGRLNFKYLFRQMFLDEYLINARN